MTRIIGISGSLRHGSYNMALIRAAAILMPKDARLQIESIRSIPLYDGDLEAAEGIPQPVAALKEAIATADGLLLATPEYNNSIPGVFKNAIDWLSRPPADIQRVFGGKAVALIGASPGGFGTILSQNAWLPVLHYLGAEYWSAGRLHVSRAQGVFDDAGTLTDADVKDRLRDFLRGVSLPGEHGYAAATAIWAKPVSSMPRAVVHCRTTEDVQLAIRTARDCGLPLSVRGGGHHWAGLALCVGIVIDLSGMNGVSVNTDHRSAIISGRRARCRRGCGDGSA
jgi:NAD(P)H-dependent FMN reductase